MFPIRDHSPSGTTPSITCLLIAANVAMYLLTLPLFSGGGRQFRTMTHGRTPYPETDYAQSRMPRVRRWKPVFELPAGRGPKHGRSCRQQHPDRDVITGLFAGTHLTVNAGVL